ncbi:MAG: hypothetical protein L3J00_04980 [Thiomicrorhabdus sp.]|nr:hypothetical protein [Thiomicrorhabdus sp.]
MPVTIKSQPVLRYWHFSSELKPRPKDFHSLGSTPKSQRIKKFVINHSIIEFSVYLGLIIISLPLKDNPPKTPKRVIQTLAGKFFKDFIYSVSYGSSGIATLFRTQRLIIYSLMG